MPLSVAIVGATGYTGLELFRLLSQHPEVEITAVTSEQSAGKALDQVFPFLQGWTKLSLESFQPEAIAKRAQLAFLCLPHQKAMAGAAALRKLGVIVIDLSADFRLHDASTYENWYGQHLCPDLLPQATYGLPELHRDAIRNSDLIANPGCYPTSCVLALAPLIANGLIELSSIHCDSKSGVSGAGRQAEIANLFAEVNEGVKAYKVGTHRHTPEIEQEISQLAGEDIRISFTPHLMPMNRGILSTVYAKTKAETNREALQKLFQDFYQAAPFVRVRPAGQLPSTTDVRLTNYCDLGVEYDARVGRVIVVSAIDNLVKGASGQAVQNMNLRFGFEETAGLQRLAALPA